MRPVSRLPTPGSKLPTPGSRLPAPAQRPAAAPTKRNAGHDYPLPQGKRPRLDTASSLPDTQPSAPGANTRNLSTSRKPVRSAGAAAKPPAPSMRRAGGITASRSPGAVSSSGAARAAPKAPPNGHKTLNKTFSGSCLRKGVTNNGSSSSAAKSVPPSAAITKAPASAAGKKRAAWDLKGRLLDMEEAMSHHRLTNSSLQDLIGTNNGRIQVLEQLNSQLQGDVAHKEHLTNQASDQIHSLERKLRESRDELEDCTSRLNRKLTELEFDKSTVERQKVTLETELMAEKQECAGLKSAVASLTSAQAGLQAELSATKLNLEKALENGRLKAETIDQLKDVIEAQQASLEELVAKNREHETVRRQLHNTIQELKGNIRVFCRVRPLLGDELLGNNAEIGHMYFPADNAGAIELEKLGDCNINESVANARRGSGNKYEFNFDRVFSPSSTQAGVFEEISQLVQSALDGYNVCIFAYGQTGSGKTHTMEGPLNPSAEHEGMIPRAVRQVFLTATDLEDKGWQYDFEVSFLEIYNETIRDLLGSDHEDIKHDLKMVSAHSAEVMVTNMTTVKVTSPDKVHSLLRTAGDNRAVAETKCNERSSRSHSVFRLKLTGHNVHTDEQCVGLLNLIDLAGSERLKDSGSQGQRLKETQSINKSLSNLGNVIMALANKDPHIPFRNSKLTHLLQNCLGGSSKVLMFVNVSPKEECFGETLNSLRFATKVNNCNIGTAQKKTK